MYAAIAFAIVGLSATITFLVLKAQRDKARQQVKDIQSNLTIVQGVVRDQADRLVRAEELVADLKAELEQKAKELYEFAKNNPRLAGDILARVLSPPKPTNPAATRLPPGAAPGGKPGDPKTGG